MKKILLLLALSSTPALASAPREYLLEMKVSMGGKLMSSPRVSIQEGKKAEISDMNSETGNGTFLEVTVKRVVAKEDNQAFLQMVVGRLNKGKKEIMGEPQFIALENEEASIELGEGLKQVFKVAATVRRQN